MPADEVRPNSARSYEVNLKTKIMALHEKLDEIRANDLAQLLTHLKVPRKSTK